MDFIIPSLSSMEALDFAGDLSGQEVNDAFELYADMKWVRPFGMLLASCAIRQFRDKHSDIPFKLSYNTGSNGVSYASHMGFFKMISEKIDVGKAPGEASGNNNYIPITKLDLKEIHTSKINNGCAIELGEAIENKAAELARIICRNKKEMHLLITYLIREILRNIPEHADCSQAWICGQYWDTGEAEIAIVDEGRGVRCSLQSNIHHFKYIKDDEDALFYAIKAGISQSFGPAKPKTSMEVWSNSGFGLYMVSEICKELNGSFCLASGGKYIYASNKGTRIGDTYFQGTAVKMTIPTDGLIHSKDVIAKIAAQGEEQARSVRNAFRKASEPSKGLITKL